MTQPGSTGTEADGVTVRLTAKQAAALREAYLAGLRLLGEFSPLVDAVEQHEGDQLS